jgi:hypothetical protein
LNTPTPEDAIRRAIASLPWLHELAEYAVNRHGFGDSDGGNGLTYPGDLDEYDREVAGINIPEGFIQVYGRWGPPHGYELLVLETDYLTILGQMLADKGYSAECRQVRSLLSALYRAKL